MITTSDIVDILYGVCAPFEIDVFRKGYIPDGEVTRERIVIIPKDQTTETYWRKCFIEVNICVPDIGDGIADLNRLQELERLARRIFLSAAGEYDDSYYAYSISSINGVIKDDNLKCHYVNVRLLFEVLNVMEYEAFYRN